MKCLSFLGAGNLKETDYLYAGRDCRTCVIQEAIIQFLEPDEIYLLHTDWAYTENGRQVRETLERYGNTKITWIKIPEGRSEEELWEIFGIIVDTIDHGEEIVFDITHGFRSLPFIAFLVCAYLRAAKDVSISKIIYGAFASLSDSSSPVFDLTPFITLLDWTYAIQAFGDYVDASPIRDLVSEIQARAYKSRQPQPPVILAPWSDNLNGFTSAVRLARPVDAIKKSAGIADMADRVNREIGRYVAPMGPLTEKIFSVGTFSEGVRDTDTFSRELAESQRRLVRYQVDKGLYLQALTVARELLVSVLIFTMGDGDQWLRKNVRENAEKTYGAASKKIQGKNYFETAYTNLFFSLDSWKDLTGIWDQVTELRNDLAHAGMSDNPKSLKKIAGKAKVLPDTIDRFFEIAMNQHQ